MERNLTRFEEQNTECSGLLSKIKTALESNDATTDNGELDIYRPNRIFVSITIDEGYQYFATASEMIESLRSSKLAAASFSVIDLMGDIEIEGHDDMPNAMIVRGLSTVKYYSRDSKGEIQAYSNPGYINTLADRLELSRAKEFYEQMMTIRLGKISEMANNGKAPTIRFCTYRNAPQFFLGEGDFLEAADTGLVSINAGNIAIVDYIENYSNFGISAIKITHENGAIETYFNPDEIGISRFVDGKFVEYPWADANDFIREVYIELCREILHLVPKRHVVQKVSEI